MTLSPNAGEREWSSDITNPDLFDRLVSDAAREPISGWDFSYIDSRWQHRTRLPWDYNQRVREAIPQSTSLLDMGTGGGERLSGFAPLPTDTWATEAYAPNVPVAKARLEPLGVKVVQIASKRSLPFDANRFDTIINRHEAFWATELFRVLKPGGRFITQQVGERHFLDLNERLLERKVEPRTPSSMQRSSRYLAEAGLEIVESEEAFGETIFLDVGAVVYFLRIVSWTVPNFSAGTYRRPLVQIHNDIQQKGDLLVHAHNFFIEARKPPV